MNKIKITVEDVFLIITVLLVLLIDIFGAYLIARGVLFIKEVIDPILFKGLCYICTGIGILYIFTFTNKRK